MAEPVEAEQLDKEAFAAFLERSRSGDDGPVVMLNLLALKPDGLLLASLFGGDTLHELRLSLIEAESELTGGAGPRAA